MTKLNFQQPVLQSSVSHDPSEIIQQCWGKLLLKVRHYNIEVLPKKVTNYVSYFLWKVMRYVTFELLFKSGQGLLACF